ncbi:MAG: hypothetical protein KDA84_23500, partial [Planctomycetaceae bacterium]|nr:hypothetical protein [Planctomycetaceae bacterium]
MVSSIGLCITSSVPRQRLRLRQTREIYQAYRAFPDRINMPICFPYLIDLAAILLFDPPDPLMSPSRSEVRRNTLRNRYLNAYQQRHLCVLRDRPTIRFVRQQMAKCSLPQADNVRYEIVARFVGILWSKIYEVWRREESHAQDLEHELEPTSDILDSDLKHNFALGLDEENEFFAPTDEEPSVSSDDVANSNDRPAHQADSLQTDLLLTNPVEMMGYLAQISELVADRHLLRDAFNQLELFLQGARTRVPDAFELYDAALISECLQSQSLDNPQFAPERITLENRYPEVPSTNPGEQASIRSIRVTNRLENLAHVIPQELGVMRTENGREHMLQKLTNDGLNMWERQSFDEVFERNRFLLVLATDRFGRVVHGNSGRHQIRGR